MWSAKPFLAVIFFSCVLSIKTGARANGINNGVFNSASAYATAGASSGISALNSANTFTGAFEGIANIPDTHNKQIGIRSYDNSGFSYSNGDNHGIGSYGTPTEYDASQDYGIKNKDRDYNKNDCSNCKWENDDYWEREEPEKEEEEKNDDECDEGDDGQYRPDKTYHHEGNKPKVDGLPSPGIHKIGPTNVYDDGIKDNMEPDAPDRKNYANTNFPSNIGYTEPANIFGTTPKSRWNTEVIPNDFGSSTRPSLQDRDRSHRFDGSSGITPISENLNTGFNDIPTTRYPSSQRPAPSWNVDHTSVPGYGITPRPWNAETDSTPKARFPFTQKPELNWNSEISSTPIPQFPHSQKPETIGNAEYDNTPDRNFGMTPKPVNWNTGPNDRPETTWNPNFGNKPAGTTSCTQYGSNCIAGKQLPVKMGAPPIYPGLMKSEFPRGSGYNQPSGNECSQEGSRLYQKCIFTTTETSPEPINKERPETSNSGSTTNKKPFDFGTEGHSFEVDKPTDSRRPYDNKPYDGETQLNPVFDATSRTPESTISDNKFGYEIKPHTVSPKNRYGTGSTTDASNTVSTFETTRAPHRGNGPNRNAPRGQSNIYNLGKFPQLPTGSEVNGHPRVTQPGSGSTSRPASSSGPHNKTKVKPSFTTEAVPFGYDSTTSSTTANVGTNTFETPFGTHGSPSKTVTTPSYDVSRHQPGGSPYHPHDNFGNMRPIYETTPHVGHSEDVSKPWSSRRPGVGSQQPDIGSGAWPHRQPETGSGTLPSRRPETDSGIGTWPDGQPKGENAAWPNKRPDDTNGAWPHQQPETRSGSPADRRPETGSGIGAWPGGQPRGENAAWPNKRPDDTNGAWPHQQPENGSKSSPARRPETGSGIGTGPRGQPGGENAAWPNKRPDDTNGAWPHQQPETGSKSSPARRPETGSGIGTGPRGLPRGENAAWPNKRPDDRSGVWPHRQPETGSSPARRPETESGIGTWPGGQPGGENAAWPNNRPDDTSEAWPHRQPETGSGSSPARRPETGSGIGAWPGGQPREENPARPNKRPDDTSETWPNRQPEIGSPSARRPETGSGIGTWPGGQPRGENAAWPNNRPDDTSEAWPHRQPETGSGSSPARRPETGSGIGAWPGGQPRRENPARPNKRPDDTSKTWPNRQPETGSPSARHPETGSGIGTRPDVQPKGENAAWPNKRPDDTSGAWPHRQPEIGSLPARRPETESGIGTWPGGQPRGENAAWPNNRPDDTREAWPHRQPETGSGSSPARRPVSGSGIGAWPGGQSRGENAAWPNKRPDDTSGTWPHRQPETGSGSLPARRPETGSGIGAWPGGQPRGENAAWPNKRPDDTSGAWPHRQPETGSGSSPARPETGSGVGALSGGQPRGENTAWPNKRPDDTSETWPNRQPETGSPSARRPETGSGIGTWPGGQPRGENAAWPNNRPDDTSEAWPHRQPETGSGSLPARRPETGSGIGAWPGGQPREEHPARPNKRPDDTSETWPNRQPETGSPSARRPETGSGIGTWPDGQPKGENAAWPNKRPDDTSGAWPHRQPEIGSPSAKQPEEGSRNWPSRKPNDESGSWPGNQPDSRNHPFDIKPGLCDNTNCNGINKPASRSECSSTNCEGSTLPIDSNSKCGESNYNCLNIGSEDGCSGRDNGTPSGNEPCRGLINDPSSVGKTYYPTGTNDGNVRNTYRPNTPFNVGSDSAYPLPGRGCMIGDNSCNRGSISATDSGPIKWNPQNPFLFGAQGGTPSDVSRPWNIATTDKPLGVGNPFFDSGWNIPNPGYKAGNENKKVIPLGGTDIKPIGRDNPFLYNNKQRDDIGINQGVIPLGEEVPGKNNPFLRPPGDQYTNPSGHGVIGDKKDISKTYSHDPSHAAGSRIPGGSNYGNVKNGVSRGGIPPQSGNYPTEGIFQNNASPQCKLGLFGCGTPGSGSYATTTIGTDNNFGRTNSNEETNPWNSASAPAGSYSGSWPGNHPVKVKG